MGSEIELTWTDGEVAFRDRLFCRQDVGGELDAAVPAYDPARVRRIALAEMPLRRRYGPALALKPGRFYPRRLAGPAQADGGNDLRPMRVLAVDDVHATVDFNHPLARFAPRLHGVSHPALGEVQAAFDGDPRSRLLDAGAGMAADPPDGGAMTWLDADALRREDEADDARFYAPERRVHHLDARARATLAARYGETLVTGMRVLDLMSSWTSHLPDAPVDIDVTGLGMNAGELDANPRLARRVVQDLNRDPVLPFGDAAFDRVLCTVSIEYLIRPVEVMREVRRVLAPGGRVLIAFSDRWFPTKAVRVWTELHPFQRPGLVLHYLRAAGGFTDLQAESIQGLARPADDKYASQRGESDPLFIVSATTAPERTPAGSGPEARHPA